MEKRENDPRAGETTYYVDGHNAPEFVRTEHIVTSVRVKPSFGTDRITVWNRGASCGAPIVANEGDGEEIARRLLTEDVAALDKFRTQVSVLLACSSPDGSAELGQIETLIEIARDDRLTER